MQVKLAYGDHWLEIELPDERTTVVEPIDEPAVLDERAAVNAALRAPIASPPLATLVRPDDQIVVVFSDLTRPVPNRVIIPAILEELGHVPAEQVTLLNATGLHRPNTPAELDRMLGAEITGRYRVINHAADDPTQLALVGTTSQGTPVWLNRAYVAATRRIVTGFIEPHFFAGFSGGSKSVLPGVAGMVSIMANHNAAKIGHPGAAWGVTVGNPIFEESREAARLAPPHFMLNVTLNREKRIAGVFAGALEPAHDAGCTAVKRLAMRPVDAPFEIVVTTNSGFPLDLNLYQAVKGMSAAAQVIRPGGAIVMAAECREGLGHSFFAQLLHARQSPDGLLEMINTPGFAMLDQWQVQIQAQILPKARVFFSSDRLLAEDIRAAHLEPCADIGATVCALLDEYGPTARIGVLPLGPLTIPYVQGAPA
ncbi:MAG: nickel-dependent lactate racemase [Chloroflexi bacterium]|nr:nickel-dependent lactate racemase [Chloroflexota bacterium]